MNSTDDSEGSGSEPLADVRRVRWAMVGVAAVLASVATALVVWLIAPDDEERSVPLPDPAIGWAAVFSEVPADPDRRYTDDELGLPSLIDSVVFNTPVYIRFRTAEEAVAFDTRRDERIAALEPGHERERLAFEREIEDAVYSAYGFLPSDLGAGGLLELAFVESMRECAADAGYPDINPMGASEDERAHYAAEFGLSSNAFYDLRHECARWAASYPTLDSELRDEMLNRVRKHYLQAVHDHLRDYDIAEVPVELSDWATDPIEQE